MNYRGTSSYLLPSGRTLSARIGRVRRVIYALLLITHDFLQPLCNFYFLIFRRKKLLLSVTSSRLLEIYKLPSFKFIIASQHPVICLFNLVPGPDIPGFLLQPFRKPKRIRTAFSPSQLLKLEHAFEKNHYVVGAERKQLAQALSLTETQVRFLLRNTAVCEQITKLSNHAFEMKMETVSEKWETFVSTLESRCG